jgi:hypothetical protein
VYRWYHGGSLLARATSAILKTNLIGTYYVEISNSAGTARSVEVTLIALPIPLLGSAQRSP